jgi:hypothetical protein
MASSRRRARIETLTRRYLHLDQRIAGAPDGLLMFDRAERGSLRYALGIIRAARRLGVLDELEADAFRHDDIPIRDMSDEARRIIRGESVRV